MRLLCDGKVYIQVIPNANGGILKEIICKLVREGSTSNYLVHQSI